MSVVSDSANTATNTATSMRSKRIHKAAAVRQIEILTAATSVFARQGYMVADMQTVAEAASVGKGTVYRYFPSKEELFLATLRYNLDRLQEQMDEARSRCEDPLDQLRESMRAYLIYFEQNPDAIELFVQERAFLSPESEQQYFMYALNFRSQWTSLYEDIARRYPIRVKQIEDMMDIAGDLLQGAVMMSQSPLPRRQLSERLDTLFDVYLHGVLARQ